MAIVVDSYEAVFTLKDNGGNTANKRYSLRAATVAEAVTAATAILAELLDVTDAAVAGYRVSEIYINDAFALPGEGVQIENQASIVGLIDGEVNKETIRPHDSNWPSDADVVIVVVWDQTAMNNQYFASLEAGPGCPKDLRLPLLSR